MKQVYLKIFGEYGSYQYVPVTLTGKVKRTPGRSGKESVFLQVKGFLWNKWEHIAFLELGEAKKETVGQEDVMALMEAEMKRREEQEARWRENSELE